MEVQTVQSVTLSEPESTESPQKSSSIPYDD